MGLTLLLVATSCGRSGPPAPPAEEQPADESVSTVPQPSTSLPPDTFALQPSEQQDAAAAMAVVREYYAAIQARDYARAHAMWGDSGRASGRSLAQFVAGFEETARTAVTVGNPGRVEGAAGSRYVEIPVVVDAVTTDGVPQRFEGSYILRRVVVDGATDAQRRWQLMDATLTLTPPPPGGAAPSAEAAPATAPAPPDTAGTPQRPG